MASSLILACAPNNKLTPLTVYPADLWIVPCVRVVIRPAAPSACLVRQTKVSEVATCTRAPTTATTGCTTARDTCTARLCTTQNKLGRLPPRSTTQHAYHGMTIYILNTHRRDRAAGHDTPREHRTARTWHSRTPKESGTTTSWASCLYTSLSPETSSLSPFSKPAGTVKTCSPRFSNSLLSGPVLSSGAPCSLSRMPAISGQYWDTYSLSLPQKVRLSCCPGARTVWPTPIVATSRSAATGLSRSMDDIKTLT
jgi:hypothetical protein